MAAEYKMTAEVAAVLAAHAELPPVPARHMRLAELLPGFRQRCSRLYEIDVAGVEFDFIHPMR